MKYLITFAALTLFMGCTENQRAKNWGGSMTVNLECGQRLTVATWKDDHMWYLTAPMPEGYTPVTSFFHEDSSWGVANGLVVFKECR